MYMTFTEETKCPKFLASSVIFKNLPTGTNGPIDENSPNLATLLSMNPN
jgi:hypothetical protein